MELLLQKDNNNKNHTHTNCQRFSSDPLPSNCLSVGIHLMLFCCAAAPCTSGQHHRLTWAWGLQPWPHISSISLRHHLLKFHCSYLFHWYCYILRLTVSHTYNTQPCSFFLLWQPGNASLNTGYNTFFVPLKNIQKNKLLMC